jgi:hypothetical protein
MKIVSSMIDDASKGRVDIIATPGQGELGND